MKIELLHPIVLNGIEYPRGVHEVNERTANIFMTLRDSKTQRSIARAASGENRGKGSAYERLTEAVNQRMKQDVKVTRSQALKEVAREDPALWYQYRIEVETKAR